MSSFINYISVSGFLRNNDSIFIPEDILLAPAQRLLMYNSSRIQIGKGVVIKNENGLYIWVYHNPQALLDISYISLDNWWIPKEESFRLLSTDSVLLSAQRSCSIRVKFIVPSSYDLSGHIAFLLTYQKSRDEPIINLVVAKDTEDSILSLSIPSKQWSTGLYYLTAQRYSKTLVPLSTDFIEWDIKNPVYNLSAGFPEDLLDPLLLT